MLLICALFLGYIFKSRVAPMIRLDKKWISLFLFMGFLVAGSILIMTTQIYPISDSKKILRIAVGMVNRTYEEGHSWYYYDLSYSGIVYMGNSWISASKIQISAIEGHAEIRLGGNGASEWRICTRNLEWKQCFHV